MIAVKIDGKALDMQQGAGIAIEVNNPLFTFDAVQGSMSWPFSLPLTQRNARILGHPQLYGSMDRRTQQPAQLWLSGAHYKSGQLRLRGTQPTALSCSFLSDGADLATQLRTMQIEDIVREYMDHPPGELLNVSLFTVISLVADGIGYTLTTSSAALEAIMPLSLTKVQGGTAAALLADICRHLGATISFSAAVQGMHISLNSEVLLQQQYDDISDMLLEQYQESEVPELPAPVAKMEDTNMQGATLEQLLALQQPWRDFYAATRVHVRQLRMSAYQLLNFDISRPVYLTDRQLGAGRFLISRISANIMDTTVTVSATLYQIPLP